MVAASVTAGRQAQAGARGDTVLVATVLTVAMMFGTILQFGMGVLAPLLIEDLGITETHIAIFSFVLYGCSVLVATQAGGLADRFGGRTAVLAVVLVSLVGLVVLGSATGMVLVLMCGLFAGAATGASNPSTNRYIADHFRGRRVGLLMGIKQSGVKVGQLFAGVALPPLSLLLGWRGALYCAAALALVVFLVASWVLPRDGAHGDAAGKQSVGDGTATIPAAINLLAAYAFLLATGVSSFGTFFAIFAVRGLGTSLQVAGAAVGAAGFVGIGARILWAVIVERLPSTTPALFALATGTCLSLVMFALVGPDQESILWTAAILFGLTGGTWNAVVQLTILRVAGASGVGRSSGRVQVGFSGGLAMGPLLFSGMLSLADSFRIAWLTIGVAAASAALLAAWLWGREAVQGRP